MKRIIASAGLVTLGAAGLQAAYAPGLSPMETAKPWSVSATLRGFYDDNYNNAPSNPSTPGIPRAKSSGGFEISPQIKIHSSMDQTYLGASYLYSMKYYFERKNSQIDQNHEVILKADHRLSERYKISFDDSFVYSSEPTILDPASVSAPTLRTNADALRNRGSIAFKAQLTEVLGLEAAYHNVWYDYLHDPYATLLNRFEHLFEINGTYLVQEHLTALVGYEYEIDNFTSNGLLNPADPASLTANSRDKHSHYFYVGAEHAFSSQFNGSIRAGAQYTSFDNVNNSAWDPYVELKGTYTYLPGSFVQFGFTQSRNATDVIGLGTSADLVRDVESSTFFASINHRITPRVSGSLMGQIQHSTYNGGVNIDGKVDNYFILALNLNYKINNNWSTEIGYNFDRLSSALNDRSFTRNRVYAGVTAAF